MAIIFDLDGTLINSFDVHIKLIKSAIDKVLGKDKIPLDFIKDNIRFPTKEMLNMASQNLGITITNKQMKEIIKLKDEKFKGDTIKKIKFYPKAKELLYFLKNSGIKFCIATSMNNEELNQIEPLFKLKDICEVVNSPALKHEKPDPYIINIALKTIKAKKNETSYIGDAETDYKASINAGVKFIGVNNLKLLDLGDMFFKDIKTLYNFIKKDYSYFL